MSRSTRHLGVAVSVSVAIPLGLIGCSSSASVGSSVAELRTSADSDFLEMPASHTYEVSELRLVTPIALQALETLSPANAAVELPIDSSGYIVLNDGVITAADLVFEVGDLPEASFLLTEPVVLRRDNSDSSEVYATGVFSFNGRELPRTSLKLLPIELSEESAEFEVSLALPEKYSDDDPATADEITARLVLSADPSVAAPDLSAISEDSESKPQKR
ncbi:MAG: hypothetical protein ACK5LO_12910 [Leucobacter sp.]